MVLYEVVEEREEEGRYFIQALEDVVSENGRRVEEAGELEVNKCSG